MDVLKDLKDSKKRVMANVVEQIAQREVKKRYLPWQYSILTVILTVCIGLFVYAQFSEERPLSAGEVTILDEEQLVEKIKLDKETREIDERNNAIFKLFLERDAYYTYAISQGIKLSEEAVLKEETSLRIRFDQTYEDGNLSIREDIAKLNITKEEYFENHVRPYAIKKVAFNELLNSYYEQYEGAFPFHAQLVIRKEAMDYFTAKYAKEIAYLEEKYQLNSEGLSYNKEYKSGYVVAIERDRFLVVSGAVESYIGRLSNEEIIKKQRNGVWYPIHDVKDKIIIGDKVQVTFSERDYTNTESYDYPANLDNLEIIK